MLFETMKKNPVRQWILRQSFYFRSALALSLRMQAQAAGCAASTGSLHVQPVLKEVTEWDDFTGRLEPIKSVEVRARVSGYLDSIHFKDGQVVKTGDLLFVIDPRPYEAEAERAPGRPQAGGSPKKSGAAKSPTRRKVDARQHHSAGAI